MAMLRADKIELVIIALWLANVLFLLILLSKLATTPADTKNEVHYLSERLNQQFDDISDMLGQIKSKLEIR